MLKKKNLLANKEIPSKHFSWIQAKEQKHQWPHNSDQQPLYIASWDYKIVHPLENSWAVSQEVKHRTYDLTISLGMYTK